MKVKVKGDSKESINAVMAEAHEYAQRANVSLTYFCPALEYALEKAYYAGYRSHQLMGKKR